MQIITAYATKNDCYKKAQKMTPKGIVVHSTGANNPNLKRYVDAPAEVGVNQYGNHWNNPSSVMGRKVCVHSFIGYALNKEVKVANILPYDICCWGVGAIPYDKNGKELSSSNHPNFHHFGPSYNYDPAYIQFEMCEDDCKNKEYFEAVYNVAVEYCVYLCKKFNIPVDNIVSHKEAHALGYGSNHGDPDNWWGNFGRTMNDFRAAVKAGLTAGDSAEAPTEPAKPEANVLYRVQTGAFKQKANADKLAADLKAAGFDTYIVIANGLYKVQVGAYSVKANADNMAAKLKAAGYDTYITTNGGKAAGAATTAPAAKPAADVFTAADVGKKVKCKPGVTKFSNGAKMASWVPSTALYIRAVEQGGKILLVSTEKTKKVYTGRVNASDMQRV